MKNRLLLGRRGDLRDCGNNRCRSSAVGFNSGASEQCISLLQLLLGVYWVGSSSGSVESVLQCGVLGKGLYSVVGSQEGFSVLVASACFSK